MYKRQSCKRQLKRNIRVREYIEERNGGYYIAGTRISFDSVVKSFQRGNSPEAIQKDQRVIEAYLGTAAVTT